MNGNGKFTFFRFRGGGLVPVGAQKKPWKLYISLNQGKAELHSPLNMPMMNLSNLCSASITDLYPPSFNA